MSPDVVRWLFLSCLCFFCFFSELFLSFLLDIFFFHFSFTLLLSLPAFFKVLFFFCFLCFIFFTLPLCFLAFSLVFLLALCFLLFFLSWNVSVFFLRILQFIINFFYYMLLVCLFVLMHSSFIFLSSILFSLLSIPLFIIKCIIYFKFIFSIIIYFFYSYIYLLPFIPFSILLNSKSFFYSHADFILLFSVFFQHPVACLPFLNSSPPPLPHPF